jgi:hypothetical protein
MTFGQDLTEQANGTAQSNLSKEIISEFQIFNIDSSIIDLSMLVKTFNFREKLAIELETIQNLKHKFLVNLF